MLIKFLRNMLFVFNYNDSDVPVMEVFFFLYEIGKKSEYSPQVVVVWMFQLLLKYLHTVSSFLKNFSGCGVGKCSS